MKVQLSFVPPGGGEQNYQLNVELNSIPKTGDYIIIREKEGESYFVVKRNWWYFNKDINNEIKSDTIVVECEFAKGAYNSKSHLESLKMYENRTGKIIELEASTY